MQRLNRLYEKLFEKKIDCFVVTKPINLFYLLGIDVSVGMLVVEQGGYSLFLDSRYLTLAKEKGLEVKDTPLKERFENRSVVHVEGEHCTFCQVEELKSLYPGIKFQSAMVVEEMKMIKDVHEISSLKRAAHLTVNTMQKVMAAIHEGVSEEDLESLVHHPSFTPIIAFGSNSAHIHHRPTKKKYIKKEPVLIDLGVKVDHYMGDMSRTIHSPLINQVKEAHDAAIDACKPGITLGELDLIVKKIIPFKDHSLSHGIGLEVHERPFFKGDKERMLVSNMVITIEPGLYVPGVGGARYESMVLISENGCEVLTDI